MSARGEVLAGRLLKDAKAQNSFGGFHEQTDSLSVVAYDAGSALGRGLVRRSAYRAAIGSAARPAISQPAGGATTRPTVAATRPTAAAATGTGAGPIGTASTRRSSADPAGRRSNLSGHERKIGRQVRSAGFRQRHYI